jgi:tRNA modification GTPase
MEILALYEANIDFPDEDDVSKISKKENIEKIKEIINGIDVLITTSEHGKLIRDGINVVIAGKPNVGKSSLLNVLLKEDRAIVTEIPGTTRDIIEETISINGIPVNLSDTAGIRDTKDIIEIEGVKRSKNKLETADLILLVLDGSSKLTKEDFSIINEVKNKKIIITINKTDLKCVIKSEDIKGIDAKDCVKISALKETGIDDLRHAISNKVFSGNIQSLDGGIVITNLRHKKALENARESLYSCLRAINEDLSEEFISIDLKSALDYLGEIIGKTTSEDILNLIFSRFCIGK